ncbi:MAG: hypothetical protein SNI05_05075 [Rikenellaceae bacterium]
MEIIHIYIIVGVAFVAYIVALLVSVKGSSRVDDDFEFYNEDGDHIYYDRKLIRHKQRCATTKIQK